MPRKSPFYVSLTQEARQVFETRARKYTLPFFEVLRAKMFLLAAEGRGNDEIAAVLSVGRDVVSVWRKRFFWQRLASLEERPRPGRPPVFPPRTRGTGKSHRL
jgi:hypothetical protein